MKWRIPKTRVIRKFAWLPYRDEFDVHWLETIYILQRRVCLNRALGRVYWDSLGCVSKEAYKEFKTTGCTQSAMKEVYRKVDES